MKLQIGRSVSRLDAMYFQTLAEARASGPFDYVVLGGGCYGICFAHRVLELDPAARVLILEKGSFLIPEHFQDLPSAYLPLLTRSGRDSCFDQPWSVDGELNIHGEVPYVGGRALFWNAWVPQPTEGQLTDWPDEVVQELKREWYEVGRFMGRKDAVDIGGYYGDLHREARERLHAGAGDIPTACGFDRGSALESAMAVRQTDAWRGWRRFSPISVLVQDLNDHPGRLSLVSDCAVERLEHQDGRVTRVVTRQGTYDVGGARVVLAAAVVQAAEIALRSFPGHRLAGRNLSGHLRSQVMMRVPREAFGASAERLEVAALYLDGVALGRQYHVHVSVVSNPHPDRQRDDLYRVHPDPTTLQWSQDPDYVTVLLQGLGEIPGERRPGARNKVVLRRGKAVVQIDTDAQDQAFWSAMEEAMFQTGEVLAGGHPIQYLARPMDPSCQTWGTARPAEIRDMNLVHEAGVAWMGSSPANSVTDPLGRWHGVENLYVLGGALFPTCGSYNQTLTGTALAYRTARHLTAAPAVSVPSAHPALVPA